MRFRRITLSVIVLSVVTLCVALSLPASSAGDGPNISSKRLREASVAVSGADAGIAPFLDAADTYQAVSYVTSLQAAEIHQYVTAIQGAEIAGFLAAVREAEAARARTVRPAPTSGGSVSGDCYASSVFPDYIVTRESGGNPNARNPSGAYGCFQFMPGTWNANCSDLGAHGSASVGAQVACAERVWANGAGSSHWAATR